VKAIFLDGMDYDALQLADLAIVCSGSVTLEFTCLGIPMIVAYRASRATTLQFRLVRGLIGGQRFAAMPNIIAGREIIPELLGSAAQPGSIADVAAALLRDERRRAQMRADLHAVASALGPPGASERTAEMVLELIDAKGGRNASI
jgi:lipid-A-disaccharide synthase